MSLVGDVLRRASGAVEATLAARTMLESGFVLAERDEGTSVDVAYGLVERAADGAPSVAAGATLPASTVLEGGLLRLEGSLLCDVAGAADVSGLAASSGIVLATRTALVGGLLPGVARASGALRVAGADVASILLWLAVARTIFPSTASPGHEGAGECLDLLGLEVAVLAAGLAAVSEDMLVADGSTISLDSPEFEVNLSAVASAPFTEVSAADGNLRCCCASEGSGCGGCRCCRCCRCGCCCRGGCMHLWPC